MKDYGFASPHKKLCGKSGSDTETSRGYDIYMMNGDTLPLSPENRRFPLRNVWEDSWRRKNGSAFLSRLFLICRRRTEKKKGVECFV